MAFDLYSDVILTTDLPKQCLKAGDVGAVVEYHTSATAGDGYSVEFFDMIGNTVAVVVIPAEQLRAPTDSDRPAVRAA
jgi:hypothetical protein